MNLPSSLRLLSAVVALGAGTALAQVPGKPAPDFTLTDIAGKPVRLADFRGKYVVLEWTNPDCPFVRNHYRSGNMQALQKGLGGNDVVWLTINSTSRSHPEFKTPAQMADWIRDQGAAPQDVLIDGESAVARQYGVKTTPEMYVINPGGNVIYAGAIDDRPGTRRDDPPAANNYVRAALAQARSGQPVEKTSSTPYGCSLKY